MSLAVMKYVKGSDQNRLGHSLIFILNPKISEQFNPVQLCERLMCLKLQALIFHDWLYGQS